MSSRTTDAPARQSATRPHPRIQALPAWSAVPSNSEDDRIWWKDRAATLLEGIRATRRASRSEPGERTVAIDLAGR